MTSEEPSRLGIHHLLPNRDFTDRGIGAAGLAFKIEFHRLFQIGHGLATRRAKAGYLNVETLGNDEFILPVQDVRDCLHAVETTMQAIREQPCKAAPVPLRPKLVLPPTPSFSSFPSVK